MNKNLPRSNMDMTNPDNKLQHLLDRYQLLKDLQNKGWTVEVGDTTKLVAVERGGAIHCVDGRKWSGWGINMKGPKIPGGMLGIMALKNRGDKQGALTTINELKQKGFIPTVHGDSNHQEAGCGFAKLWKNGQLSGLPELELSLPEIRQLVEANGGKYIPLKGKHNEGEVRVNMRSGTTLIPDKSAFNLDPWFAAQVGVNTTSILKLSVETVEKLNGPKIIQVFE